MASDGSLLGFLAALAIGIAIFSFPARDKKRTREPKTSKQRTFLCAVAGESYRNKDGTSRQDILSSVRKGQEMDLVREPDNQHDANAIRVCTMDGRQVGYIARDIAERLAKQIDSGDTIKAFVERVTGGSKSAPSRGCVLRLFIV